MGLMILHCDSLFGHLEAPYFTAERHSPNADSICGPVPSAVSISPPADLDSSPSRRRWLEALAAVTTTEGNRSLRLSSANCRPSIGHSKFIPSSSVQSLGSDSGADASPSEPAELRHHLDSSMAITATSISLNAVDTEEPGPSSMEPQSDMMDRGGNLDMLEQLPRPMSDLESNLILPVRSITFDFGLPILGLNFSNIDDGHAAMDSLYSGDRVASETDHARREVEDDGEIVDLGDKNSLDDFRKAVEANTFSAMGLTSLPGDTSSSSSDELPASLQLDEIKAHLEANIKRQHQTGLQNNSQFSRPQSHRRKTTLSSLMLCSSTSVTGLASDRDSTDDDDFSETVDEAILNDSSGDQQRQEESIPSRTQARRLSGSGSRGLLFDNEPIESAIGSPNRIASHSSGRLAGWRGELRRHSLAVGAAASAARRSFTAATRLGSNGSTGGHAAGTESGSLSGSHSNIQTADYKAY
ncbi:unnamed protein product [Protopolystoma xenopodis]|uniref:Uncharacterized protein n=1 Tax=Protopolystoma xenopodis TaxID=117903 RepID=A0A448XH03_9PLAT|nr:unnamed protein product [Protopolystoma xenopodis]